MFNSFIDGSKSAIEMTAVCNATGLVPQPDGLSFPPVARHELAHHCGRARQAECWRWSRVPPVLPR